MADVNCISREKPAETFGSSLSLSNPNSLGPEVICSQLGAVDLNNHPVVLRFDAQDLGKESRLRESLFTDHLWPQVKGSPVGLDSNCSIPSDNTNPQTCMRCLHGAGRGGGCKRMPVWGTERWKVVANRTYNKDTFLWPGVMLSRYKPEDLESRLENNGCLRKF